MAKGASFLGFREHAMLAGAAFLTISWSGISLAQDGAKSENFISNKSTWPVHKEADLATNFDERWGGSGKEFVLGADGIVKEGSKAQEKPDQNPIIPGVRSKLAQL
jgi:hypothetical protein